MNIHCTISVRLACVNVENWLTPTGEWGPYSDRVRFRDEDEAELAVRSVYGATFQRYGLFPNQMSRRV